MAKNVVRLIHARLLYSLVLKGIESTGHMAVKHYINVKLLLLLLNTFSNPQNL